MSSPQLPIVDPPSPVDDFTPTFYVGHHESKRSLPVTDFVLRQAQDVGVGAPPRLESSADGCSTTCSPAPLRVRISTHES